MVTLKKVKDTFIVFENSSKYSFYFFANEASHVYFLKRYSNFSAKNQRLSIPNEPFSVILNTVTFLDDALWVLVLELK